MGNKNCCRNCEYYVGCFDSKQKRCSSLDVCDKINLGYNYYFYPNEDFGCIFFIKKFLDINTIVVVDMNGHGFYNGIIINRNIFSDNSVNYLVRRLDDEGNGDESWEKEDFVYIK